ncbi:MAG: sigma-70 family RNA polymerase sigma factor [Singulisphaera sp.]
MRDARAGPGWKSWRVLVEAGSVAGLADGMLLERFLAGRDDVAEVAFAALVARHGPMVRRVCRRLLVDPNDAEDAFQATFLVLARRAGAIRSPERLSSWLYGTAHRSSRKLKAQSARRRRHEVEVAREGSISVDDPGRCERAEAVLEEVARLPRSYKAAVVLCELEGLTQGEAARLLGLSERTVGRHLVRARSLLRIRLTRRGLAPTAMARLGPRAGIGLGGRARRDRGRDRTRRDTVRGRDVDGRGGPGLGGHPRGRSDSGHVLDEAEGDRGRIGPPDGPRSRGRRRGGVRIAPRVRPRRRPGPAEEGGESDRSPNFPRR